jgi:nitroimidazol reductase NimA-like FMN-containing flavoprotein (pyridoxamine 5'-phosphate oxidase superfamily)
MTDARLDELSFDECLSKLRSHRIGRVAVVVDGFPVVVPVNYRLVEASGRTWIAFRVREGGVIEQGSMSVAFQLDGADPIRREGWSVLVTGTLHRVDPEAADFRERFDPDPWIEPEPDAWLVVDPISITGRRVRSAPRARAFPAHAYH